MLIYNIFISVLLLSASVLASNKMTFYGCPEECEKQEDPSCGGEIDTDYFCALSTKLGKSYCDNYVVVMETRAKAKKIVKAKIVDSCSSCPTYHVDLSKVAFTTLTDATVGVSEIIWGIYNKAGDLITGPYYNSLSEISSSYDLSENSFIAAFKVAAGKLVASGSNSGDFKVTRGENTSIKKTTTTTTKKTTTTTTTRTTSTAQRKVITTVIKKTKTQSVVPTQVSNDDVPSNSDQTSSSSTENNTSSSSDNTNDAVPVSEIVSSKDNENDSEIQNVQIDSATPDTIVYDIDDASNISAPKQNTESYENPGVINTANLSPSDNSRSPAITEDEDTGNNNGVTAGLITAVCGTCAFAGGGVGLFLMKKNNPKKFNELKRRTTTIKANISRSLSKIGGSNKTKNQYMPANTIENDEEMARIPIYDNQNPAYHN